MYTHPTYDRLRTLHLIGMLHALEHQEQHPEITAMPFLERLGILLDAEWSLRDQKRLQSRLREARLKQPATLEDLDWQGSRRFDRSLLQSLTSDEWIRQHRNVVVLGPTGVGKTYIACALGYQACTAIMCSTSACPGCSPTSNRPCGRPLSQAPPAPGQDRCARAGRLGAGNPD